MITTANIFDVILDAIDEMRYVGNVYNTTLISGTTYTFETDFAFNLEVGKFIIFSNALQGEITNILGSLITVKCYYDNAPVDGTFKRLDPFSGQDLSIKIASNFAQKSTDPIVYDKQKFPAIEIVRDDIQSSEDNYNKETFDKINLLFITDSNHEFTGTQRNDASFKNILIPLFNRFKDTLSQRKYLRFKHEITYKKRYVDRDNYQGKNKNAVNHFVDILRIEINNLVLNTDIECNINL